MNDKSVCFAEVVESFLAYYKAQSWEYTRVPAYGALIVVEGQDGPCYALVYQSTTGSDDMLRSVHAYQKTHEELQREQPHIFALLKTTFSAVIVGYERDNKLYCQCAPVPVPIHTFVRYATNQELDLFVHSVNYLPLLFNQANFLNVDELLVAFVNYLKQKQLVNEQQLVELLNVALHLCGNDYRRIRFLAQRLEQ